MKERRYSGSKALQLLSTAFNRNINLKFSGGWFLAQSLIFWSKVKNFHLQKMNFFISWPPGEEKHFQELSGSFLAQLFTASVGGVRPHCSSEAKGVGGDFVRRQRGGEMWAGCPPRLESGPGSSQPPALRWRTVPAWSLDTSRQHLFDLPSPHNRGRYSGGDPGSQFIS